MNLTLDDLRELLGSAKSHSYEVGKSYFIRGVTLYYTGRIVSVTDEDIVLEDAAWIADTGRFSEALRTGSLSEVEPFPSQVIIPRTSIVDATEWSHALPREEK